MSESHKDESGGMVCGFCGRHAKIEFDLPVRQTTPKGWKPGDYPCCNECAATSEWNRRGPHSEAREEPIVTPAHPAKTRLQGWWHGGTDGE